MAALEFETAPTWPRLDNTSTLHSVVGRYKFFYLTTLPDNRRVTVSRFYDHCRVVSQARKACSCIALEIKRTVMMAVNLTLNCGCTSWPT